MKVHSEDLTGNYYTEDKVMANQIMSSLLSFGKKYIQSDYDAEYNFEKKIKENAQFYAIPLPDEISEKFIFYEYAPNSLMFESPLISYLHKIFKVNHTIVHGENPQRQLKEYYIKWLKRKKGTDTKYFANSMLSYLEKTKNNAFNMLMHAMVLTYDEEMFNPEKSIELISRASDIIFNKHIDDKYFDELRYFLKTTEGFLHLKSANLSSSNRLFYEALEVKHTGITAKFHLALTEIQLENTQAATDLVEDIYKTDIARLNFAIENNSLSVYEFFLNNSITKYFFLEPKFYPLLYFFEDKIELFKSHNRAILEEVKSSLFNLREIKVNSYFTERIKGNLRFIESYLRKYNGGESLLLSDSSKGIVKKFDEIIQIVDEEIKKKYYSGLEERLLHFKSKIEEAKLDKLHSEKDLESYRRRMSEKLKANLNEYDSQMSAKINAIEHKVNSLDEKSDLDPSATFRNAFTYTSMLSIMVLLLSGFASYSNSDFNEMASFSNVIRTVLVEGAKWSLITFLVGTIVSIFTTISTIVQKSSFKQNMVKKVSSYVDEKEKGKEQLRKETEFMIKQMEMKTKHRIELFEAEITDLEEKRKKEDERLRTEADSKIKFELEKLKSFYN
ncbi:MAG: hypothetical protein L3J41_15255 [Melioribacteraceae bacterium]|nr:hypothetical protein [Melioribacteraceae bacterium]